MQVNLLKNIITSLIGSSGNKIVDLLYGKKNVNEFLIAKSLKLTINQTRNILYRLADEGLVSFVRKKDRKKGGWYTYYWTLNTGKGLSKFGLILSKEIENLKNQGDTKKTKRFYYSKNCNLEFTEEVALVNHYSCPECGEVLELKDSGAEVADLEKKIAKLESVLKDVSLEINVIAVKETKIRERRAKADAKKKALERLNRRKEKQRLEKKLQIVKKVKSKKKDKHKTKGNKKKKGRR